MKKRTIIAILAAGILAAPAVTAWDQVIDFEEFELGTSKDPASDIAQLVNITRDEGYEAGRTEGFATLTIAEEEGGQQIFNYGTGGHGFSWGHTFGGINLPEPITEEGTFYMQFMTEGPSVDISISLAEDPYTSIEPTESNPWGWEGPIAWGDHRATWRIGMESVFTVRDGGSFAAGPEVVPGAWYEVWMVVDVPSELYSVYLHAPDAGIEEVTVVTIEFEGEEFEDYFFRSSAEQLASVVFGMVAGSPGAPSLGHRYWLNAVAFDLNEHNLTNPGVELPGFAPPPVIIYGFDAVAGTTFEEMRVDAFNFLGADVWVAHAPYLYSFDIAAWMYVPALWNEAEIDEETGDVLEPGSPKDPESFNMAARSADWVYIWESPFAADQWTGSAELGTWVWGTESGWAYILNSR